MKKKYALKDIRNALLICANEIHPDPRVFDSGYYSLSSIVDQVIFEYIKLEYELSAPRTSIRQHLLADGISEGDLENENRKYSRRMQYVQYYRDYLNSFFEDKYGFRHPGLEAEDLSANTKRLSGHSLTDIDFLELKMMNENPLLQKIVQRQINDVDKVNNPVFKELHDEYSGLVDSLYPDPQDSEDVIKKSIAYFRLEWKYNVELIYQLAVSAEQVISLKKSESLFSEEIIRRCKTLCAPTSLPITPWSKQAFIHVENRFLINRHLFCDDVFKLKADDWGKKEHAIIDALILYSVLLWNNSTDKWFSLISACSTSEKAEFIKSHFWLWDCHNKYEWTNTRINYYRRIRKALTANTPIPKIK